MRHQLQDWSSQFSYCCYLDSNGYSDPYGRFDLLVAAGARQVLQAGPEKAWEKLSAFRASCSDWIAGHCSYELNPPAPGALRAKTDGVGFASICFFQPDILVLVRGNEMQIGIAGEYRLAASVHADITGRSVLPSAGGGRKISWQSPMSDEDYLQGVSGLQQHLRRGDAYEVNFCREFFARDILLSPAALFRRLNNLSPAPFSAFYRNQDRFLACSSPERFLRKNGTHLMSQPMKGTAPRGRNPGEDLRRKTALAESTKERSENVMAVDLVRSDLSAVAVPGTVRVSELFGIRTFPSVHQMVSTVEAETDSMTCPARILGRAFPMGSMTGAPKHRVMQLIDTYERSTRGIYSGALGYFTPEGDFDFNVVIRSLVYHAGSRYLSFQTGSGITVYSDPQRELEECLLKGRALREAAGTA